MPSKDGTSNKEGGEESFFMLQDIQQQFELVNMVFNEIWDRMDRQNAVIVSWREVHPKESLMLEGKKGVHMQIILMTTTRMSSKMKMIKFH
jgi:hypothetical protein